MHALNHGVNMNTENTETIGCLRALRVRHLRGKDVASLNQG